MKFNRLLALLLVVLTVIGTASCNTDDIKNNTSTTAPFADTAGTVDTDEGISESSYNNDVPDYDSTSENFETSNEEPASEVTESTDITEITEVIDGSETSEETAAFVGLGTASPVELDDVPEFSGEPYFVIAENVPNFSSDELTGVGYVYLSPLDSLGRSGMCVSSCGPDTVPESTEYFGGLSEVNLVGWVQAQYDFIPNKYLWNRCHLIGWQLMAIPANTKNLTTGTKYLNNYGILPFENTIAKYIKETGNHVAYRVTPIYNGNELVCRGIQMEAYSVEDSGAGICFNIFCYNVQEGVAIDYATGKSALAASDSGDASTGTDSETEAVVEDETVWITKSGKKYHKDKTCGGYEMIETTKTEAEKKGLTPCQNCHH